MKSQRQKQIDEILKDLTDYKPRTGEEYALAENVRFFQAAKSPLSMIRWQLFQAHKIDSARLLELADLSISKWQKVLYEQLNFVERKNFPGLLKPLRNFLLGSEATIFLDIGCGNMEPERQLIEILRKRKHTRKVFIGVDLSSEAFAQIKKNFNQLSSEVDIQQVRRLDSRFLSALTGAPDSKHLIRFVQQDALNLDPAMLKGRIDIIFSSKFRHHLSSEQKKKLDKLLVAMGCRAIEFDDYHTAVSWIPLVITAWRKPVLLNGALLSRLRQPRKKMLKQHQPPDSIKFFSPPGSYIKELKSK